MISDRGDNASKHNLAQIMTMASQSDAIIYTIGVFDENDPDRDPGALKKLAQASGGEAFLPASVEDVCPIYKHIARDIRNQYSITYLPTNRNQDGGYRVIRVNAGTPGRERLSVRTRAGYYAPLRAETRPTARAIP